MLVSLNWETIAMDSLIQLLLIVLTSCLCGLSIILLRHRSNNKRRRLPQAGGAMPIIGHLHLFSRKQLLHKTLGAMADKYGAAFTIKLGSHENLVVSSWEIAKECFTTHDKVLADRPHITATKILGYNGAVFGLAPPGPYWRRMRKIATLELLSHKRIGMLSHIRVSELQSSLNELYRLKGGVVDMKEWFDNLTLNSLVRMIGGKRYMESRHRDLLKETMYIFGVFVLSDAFPWLGWVDLQGHKRKMKKIAAELDDVFGMWLEEHKERRRKVSVDEGRVDEDFMDAMLTILEQDDDFPEFDADTITKATCLNLALAGSDTSKVTLIWALCLLLNNPHTLRKAQQEVDTYISKDRHVQDSDIKNLVYLEAVVKETLRLYPGPINPLHSAMEDCTLSSGHDVPSGTRLLVNVWKIHRDERIWPEPLEFKPERFLTSHKDIDLRGNNFQFIPFGVGRRSCPGISLAMQTVQLTLASLLHCFDFNGASEAEIDMTESAGLTNFKATPLELHVTPRLSPEMFA